MASILLINPISGRGHLDSYARLYSRAFLELGHDVTLLADTDGETLSYLARCAPHHIERFQYTSLKTNPDIQFNTPPTRIHLTMRERARLVWQEEGLLGLSIRLVRVPTRILAHYIYKIIPLPLKNFSSNKIKQFFSRITNRFFSSQNKISFKRFVLHVHKFISNNSFRPDIIIYLYLDMLSASKQDIIALNRDKHLPWVGILFHPRAYVSQQASFEPYFLSETARGAIFLVPDAVKLYQKECEHLHFALVPDVADLEVGSVPHPLAQTLKERAQGRCIVLQIGSITPHKDVETLIQLIQRAEKSRYFFALIGEVYWESFGDFEPLLRAFFANPPDNVLIHEGYVTDERDYNSVIKASDILYAVYKNFNSSSNSLTKAAGLGCKILVAQNCLMGERVLETRLGAVAPQGDVEAILASLEALNKADLKEFGHATYHAAHSLETLKIELDRAVSIWLSPR